MYSSEKPLDCVVIGAGPGGLVATKELIENGIKKLLCLEMEDQIGGVFAKTYENLTLTSSATFSMFSDFLNKPGEDNYFWTKEEAIDYWGRYAQHFGVTEHIRFNTEVTSVERVQNQHWQITLSCGQIFKSVRIIIATGNNRFESYPEWAKQLSAIDYSHSKNYRNADPFKGKRVVVVGGGESASDIALEISKVAHASWISLRESAGWVVPRKRGDYATDTSTHRGLWGLPRRYGAQFTKRSIELDRAKKDPVHDAIAMLNSRIRDPRGIWSTYGTKTVALAEAIAHHNCKVVEEVVRVEDGGKCLVTGDGLVLHNIDAVVFSTGYINHTSFLPEAYQAVDPRRLYKHIFHPDTGDSLMWIGVARPGFGSQFPIMEMQARLCALICAGKHQLPSAMAMNRSIQTDYQKNMEQFGRNAKRIRSLVDYFHYMDEIAELIGCKPPLKNYIYRHPTLWLKMMYGPAQATQYRLVGPGRKRELAHYILKNLPLSRFNNVVKIGLRLRLMQLFEGAMEIFRRD